MTFKNYLYDKCVSLCFIGIGTLGVISILAFLSVEFYLVVLLMVFVCLVTISWLIVDYQILSNKLKKLKNIVDELEELYLLAEVLPQPKTALEYQYYQIMKHISSSAIEKAEQAKQDKEEYLEYVESWIHEIKTPLTACSLILSNDQDIKKLKYELKRADNLTESILYYARLRTIENDMQIKKVDVIEVCNSAIQYEMELLRSAKITVAIEGELSVFTDKNLLGFIMKQFIINTVKYCPLSKIKIKANGNTLVFEDNGIGIPSYELPRVFDRGFIGRNTNKNNTSTGMGLYIAYQLCQKLNIHLTIESKEQEYTRFILEFSSLTKS